LAEQERIVARLDAAFAAIAEATAAAEANLRNARALFDSYLDQVFSTRGEGWVERRLGDVAVDFGRGKSKHRPRNAPELYDGRYPFVHTGDVRNAKRTIIEYTQTYNEAGLRQSKLWPKGTICITIAANIAETAILDFDACFPDSIIGLVVDQQKAHNGFVMHLLQNYKKYLQSLSKGSAQDNINLGTFEDEFFSFPDLAEQRELDEKLTKIQNQCDYVSGLYTKKLTALAELKQALLAEVFGEG
jgi:type I restriction enzyme S subunit